MKVDHYRLFHQALKPRFLLHAERYSHGGDTAHLADEVKSARRHNANSSNAAASVASTMLGASGPLFLIFQRAFQVRTKGVSVINEGLKFHGRQAVWVGAFGNISCAVGRAAVGLVGFRRTG